MDGFAVFSLVLTLLLLFYKYLIKNNDYWKSRGVKYKKSSLFFGSIKDRFMAKKSFHEFYGGLYSDGEGEPYIGFYEGLVPVLMIRDPDLLRTVLSKDFDHFVDRGNGTGEKNPYIHQMMISLKGEEWKNVRSIVAPTFSTGRIKKMLSMIQDCTQSLKNHIQKLIQKNGDTTGDVDMKDMMSKFTLDVIASTAFGVTCDSLKKENSEFSSQIQKITDISMFSRMAILSMLILNVPIWIRQMFKLSFFKKEVIDFLAGIIKDTTQYRLNEKIRRNDFLQLLMDAQGLTDDGELENKKEVITEDVAIAQSILFLIAGNETSGMLLTMVCYELAQNLQIQDKLRSEINKKYESCSGTLSYEDLNTMTYLDMVIAETLRLHPPVGRIDRLCTKNTKVGSLKIEEDVKICVSISGLHMDAKYFPEPHVFKPERFTEEEKAKRHAYVYLPFGQGPRNCIGMRFAQMGVKLCIAEIIHNYILSVSPMTEIPFVRDKRSMFLKPASGIFLQLSPISY